MIDTTATETTAPSGTSPGFAMGFITGGIIGAVMGLVLAPRAGADLRRGLAGAAKDLGAAASKEYEDASDSVGDAVERLVNKGQSVTGGPRAARQTTAGTAWR
jgi:gas vesicle protein